MSIRTVLFVRIEEWVSSSLKLYGAFGFSLLAHAALLISGSALYSPIPLRQSDAIPSGELIVNLVALAPSYPSSSSPSMRLVSPAPHAEAPTQPNSTQIAIKPSVERKGEGTSSLANTTIDTESPAQMNPSSVVATFSTARTDAAGPDSPPTNVTVPESTELSDTDKHAAENAALRLAKTAPQDGAIALLDAPRPQYAPEPDYPDEARWEEREGRTVLRFRLHPGGNVGEAQLVDSSGHADLDAAALATLRQWRFKPPSDASASPESWYRYAFRFALR